MEKWNESGYGQQNIKEDMWGQIETEVAKGWFVPSRAELAVFGGELGITSMNYASKGLSSKIWSSSQYDTGSVWSADFNINLKLSVCTVAGNTTVRLSTTY